jgi:CubicO group peptidase (beta-lactamase class C family)
MTFGRALTQVLQQPMEIYLKEKVTSHMGMEWTWGTEKDLNGIPINNGCTSVMLNAKNLARWGWLFLNQGNWAGVQLISKAWVQQATSVQVPITIPVGDTDRKYTVGPGCYGFNLWVNGKKADGTWKLPGATEDTYFASGFSNNKCLVIPSWNMVVIRMGEDVNLPEADQVYGRFLAMLGEAIK